MHKKGLAKLFIENAHLQLYFDISLFSSGEFTISITFVENKFLHFFLQTAIVFRYIEWNPSCVGASQSDQQSVTDHKKWFPRKQQMIDRKDRSNECDDTFICFFSYNTFQSLSDNYLELFAISAV